MSALRASIVLAGNCYPDLTVGAIAPDVTHPLTQVVLTSTPNRHIQSAVEAGVLQIVINDAVAG
jgi:hypothetical protein